MTEQPRIPIVQRMRAKAVSLNVPYSAHLELTDRCNLACRHCYVPSGNREQELSLDEWRSYLDQLAEAKTLYLVFSGGEILLRPDFFEIAQHARKLAFHFNLFTNATLIDEEAADRIRDLYPHRVETSIYGSCAETHDAITQVPGSFDKLLRAVRLLRERDVGVQMKVTWMALNIGEWEDIHNLVRDLGATFRSASLLMERRDGRRDNLSLHVSEEDMRAMFLHLFEREQAAGRKPPPSEPGPPTDEMALRTSPCGIGSSTCCIDSRGHVHPCAGAYQIDLGSLRSTAFREIWEGSEKLKEIRKIRLADLATCKDCKLWHYCSRCAAMAAAEEGSLTAPSQQACAGARAKYGLFYGKACEID